MNNKQILETLKMQPLSDEEKAARHILGRLYGPIATCAESTRNGRKYNRELWTKALNDDIVKEKVSTKSLFLELGHPADREETDMTKVCACIPEMPKIVGDDLYAYVDILDTPNGKLLKTLCDYGFIPGISSRGSGDIMANDEVDPDTFFLETWDIVQLPAVKKARLSMCESLGNKTLRTALAESYDAADEKDKQIMKESLDNLNIKLTEDAELELLPGGTPANPAFIVASQGEEPLMEASEEEEAEEVEETEEVAEGPVDEEPVEEVEETAAKEETEEASVEEEPEVTGPVNTVAELVKEIQDYDNDLAVEFKPLEIGDLEIPVQSLGFEPTDDGKLLVSINYDYNPEMDDNKEAEEVEAEEPVEVAEVEANETEEEAIDDGTDEVMESLKEAIRQKAELEEEIKTLKQNKTVGDAEVEKLKEDLNKYKVSFARVSEVAAKSTQLTQEVKSLTEEINLKDKLIKDLEAKAANTVKLNESVNATARQVKDLTEQLKTAKDDVANLDKQLEAQKVEYNTKLTESNKAARAYKAKFQAVLNRYIESKASMLGVKTTDITSRLNESYTLDDIDNICDELLEYNINMSRLPFGISKNSRVKIAESAKPAKANPENGYEIDDDLLTLAGLKK